MFDQEFSIENLKKLIKRENRKGRYIVSSCFPDVSNSYDNKIKTKTDTKNKLLKHISNEQEKAEREERNEADEEVKAEIRLKAVEELEKSKIELKEIEDEIDNLRRDRDKDIDEGLREIIRTIEAKDFNVELFIRESNDPEKPHYVLDDSVTRYDMGDRYGYSKKERTISEIGSYFAEKHLQYCLRNLYRVKPANRNEIISQLSCILDDSFPKYIYRADVQSFYESIPKVVYDHVLDDTLLSERNKKTLRQIRRSYFDLADTKQGVPRGIGVSAYLVEIYMRKFDEKAVGLRDLVYYKRYVDDMIFVFAPSSYQRLGTYENEIDGLFDKFDIKKNSDKSKGYGCKKSLDDKLAYDFDILGYNFQYGKDGFSVGMSRRRYDKILSRIDAAAAEYLANRYNDNRKADRLLYKRLKYLTSNTRLLNNKDNVLVGIYYSNRYVNRIKQIECLDCALNVRLDALKLPRLLKERLDKLSFKAGFEEKRFTKYDKDELKSIFSWSRQTGA